MNVNTLMKKIKTHPKFDSVGMVLCHNGVVRSTSRDGRPVSGLRVAVDHQKLSQVIKERKKMTGVIDIQVAIAENKDLTVGDDVMILIVAGDIREHVLSALSATLDDIKATVTSKTEYFV